MLDNEPNVGANGPAGDITETTAQPRRRRAASRPAGPPPEPEDLEPAAEPAAAVVAVPEAVAAPVGEDAPAPAVRQEAPPTPQEEAPPKRATRRRTAAADEEGAPPARRSRTRKAAAEPAAQEVAAQEVAAAPVKRTRTRKKAAEAAVEPAAEAVAEAVVGAAATEPEPPVDLTTAEAAEVAASLLLSVPAGEPAAEEEPAGDRPGLFTDPFGLTVAERAEVPSVTFQAPAAVFQPLFQAPDPSLAVQQPPARPAPAQPFEPAGIEEEPEEDEGEEPEEDEGEGDDEAAGRRRRRRRGGRGRGKTREQEEAENGGSEQDAAEAPAGQAGGEQEEAETEEGGTSRRRRRRRRRGSEEEEDVQEVPPNTVVRIRAPRAGRGSAMDEVQSVRGSTRLEAKKQRRREGRELGRRRPPIITESEFLARRESVERVMVVRRTGDRTQIAVLEDDVLVEHYVNREAGQSYVGNVYLGKVQNVLPSMEAAFIDIGKGRNAVLYAGEVNFDTAGLEGQPKRIEVALKSGQPVLVQVTKDPMGHKGARLTSQISLPGRYLVYVPDGSMTGISRKLPDKERTRLKSILKKVMPENAGVIVRTAAEGASEEELGRDVARLSAQWENIQRKAKSASAPELLSSEPDLTVRVVRDVFNEDFTSLVVAGEVWDTVDEYVRYVAPHLADRLTKWDETGDVFAAYRIDEQIAKAMERKVWLPSGGSLVIDRTEAMTVVDVNTGKFTGQGGNLEETVTRNNLEAAEEIVRQLRLRDIGGIIVIDFIDMVLESNRDLVLRRLLECLARDRTKHQVAEVTSLGLVQMTRKRVGQGLLEAFSTVCECCNGRGLHISSEPVEGRPEPRGTQGKMAVEKAVAEKLAKDAGSAVAASEQSGRDTVTDALDDAPDEGTQAVQAAGRGRRRSRKAKPAD
ncbi:Rne/Rng family ribonuclease [Planomonospora sp. ID82291]|uniref:Rne/Rng family ribonuclease n=1 Tax=Planomonospora sp. ID82291 TaxID=2738136 RepID=UPI0018C4354A|nr:Rne/Rng family ribonuclease [Planomonospora sp. ID82291]MBG0812823.1 Rne/Rng family ribonuclease [Planomonospora sp. ID82291]